LSFFIDCQDHTSDLNDHPCVTEIVSAGATVWESNEGNLSIGVCIVESFNLMRTGNVDYAVLRLNVSPMDSESGLNYYTTYMTNEATETMSSASILDSETGTSQQVASLGYCSFNNGITGLAFIEYPKKENTSVTYFPDLGFPYYVFGRFGKYQGFFYSDDEDGDNNQNYLQGWPGGGNTSFIYIPDDNDTDISKVPEFLQVTKNTCVFFSRVTSCNF